MQKYTILIVDDKPNNIISLKEILKNIKNISIEEANSGKKALLLLLEKKINLVLLDIQMPEMDGFEVAMYMKKVESTKDIPIIFLTAIFTKDEFIKRGYTLGAIDYLSKPINDIELINKISLYVKLYYREKTIEKQKIELNAIFENVSLGIALVDVNGEIKRVNKTFFELIGIKDGNISTIFAISLLIKEEIVTFNTLTLNLKLSTIVDSQNRPLYILCIIKDITEKLKLEKEKKEQDEYINYQSRFMAMGEVVSMIAHQWRQPLNAISSSVADLKIKFSLNSIDRETLLNRIDFIEDNTQKLSKIISDFMDLSKADDKKEEFFLKELIDNILKLLDGKLKKLNVKIENLIEKNLKIFGHRGLMEQVIINLITNSFDAYELNKIKKRVISISSKVDDTLIIIYKDNAGGVKKEVKEKVFNPYFSTKDNGVGIGLYMVKRIIERSFSGRVELKNIDEGVEFYIYLDRKD